MSQEALCDAHISRNALSRIENGKQIPSMDTLERLLEKLGFPLSGFMFALDKNEFDDHVLIDRLQEHTRLKQYDEADTLIAQMEKMRSFQAGLKKQKLLICKTSIHLDRHRNTRIARAWLDESIRITIPRFKEDAIETYMLTNDEITTLNMMANIYFYDDNINQAIHLFNRLINTVQNTRIDEKSKAYPLSMMYYNVSKYLGMSGRRMEALEACEQGIRICVQHMEYAKLPMLLLNKAYGQHDIGDDEYSKFLYMQVYYMSIAIGDNSTAVNTKTKVKELFGDIFPY